MRLELSGCIPCGYVLFPARYLHGTHGTLEMRKAGVIDNDPFFIKEKVLKCLHRSHGESRQAPCGAYGRSVGGELVCDEVPVFVLCPLSLILGASFSV